MASTFIPLACTEIWLAKTAMIAMHADASKYWPSAAIDFTLHL
jgi:hypothetical protein